MFLENELKTQKINSLSLEKQVSELNRKISSLESQLSMSESEAKAKAETVEQHVKQLDVLAHEKEQLGNNLNALQEAYAGLQAEMEHKGNEVNTQLTSIDEKELLQTLNTNNTNMTMRGSIKLNRAKQITTKSTLSLETRLVSFQLKQKSD